MDLPAEIARREVRLKALDAAKLKIEVRAKERFDREQAEYQRKEAKRQAQRDAGKKPKDREPKPPQPRPKDKDQVILTDEESRIMPVSVGDTGYFSANNVELCVKADAQPLLAVARDHHHLSVFERFAAAHGTQADDPGWSRIVWAKKTDGGTGFRHHQARDGFQAVLDARIEESVRRMDARHAGVECETYECTENGVIKRW